MTRTSPDTYWMVRTFDMRVFRPIPQDVLIEKIAAGVIAPNDELCPGNGYWFSLSEVNEVRAHLGDIDLSCLHSKDKASHTSSTDTRPIQKTSIISQKITLEDEPAKVTKPAHTVRKKQREAEPAAQTFSSPSSMNASPASPQINEEYDSGVNPHRTRNAIGVAVVFFAFILVMVLFWLGSY